MKLTTENNPKTYSKKAVKCKTCGAYYPSDMSKCPSCGGTIAKSSYNPAPSPTNKSSSNKSIKNNTNNSDVKSPTKDYIHKKPFMERLVELFSNSPTKEQLKIQSLEKELEELKASFTPEMRDVQTAKAELESTKSEINELNKSLENIRQETSKLNTSMQIKRNEIIVLDEQILLQDFGLYEPKFDFTNSEQYKEKLDKIREEQKRMIKNETAVTGNMDWSVNGSYTEGKKLVKDTIKLLLRAFNTECDSIIEKVKYNNYEQSEKRIIKACDAVTRLGKIMKLHITKRYLDLKIQELQLALEFKKMKQQEKEEQKEAKQKLREEAKLQKEIAEARKNIEKEKNHYQNALKSAKERLDNCNSEEERTLLEEKISEIENQLIEIDKNIKDIDYREANKRAGYVYIISNIGSFGENIFKIGMTRRLIPEERIDELGDASVPFDFDIHAMIFSDDAPSLETALHKAFENKKLNMINTRREFFNVTLEEIEDVVKKNYDKSVEFIKISEAEQYRESQKIREQLSH